MECSSATSLAEALRAHLVPEPMPLEALTPCTCLPDEGQVVHFRWVVVDALAVQGRSANWSTEATFTQVLFMHLGLHIPAFARGAPPPEIESITTTSSFISWLQSDALAG